MNYSINHNIEVGEIISSLDDQIAIADAHEIWEHDQDDANKGKLKTVGEATIRIISGAEKVINTNWMSSRGVVCFLPKECKGYGILKIKITHIYNKSVEAVPVDYIKRNEPLEFLCEGQPVNEVLQAYPNMTRVQEA